MKLEVIQLTNNRYVKPEGSMGTCGWYPKAWQIAPIGRYESPIQAFLSANKNWKLEELVK